MRTTADFLDFYRKQRRWTLDLVASIPEEHFDWRPSAESFSCGDLVRHLMQAEIFWTRLLTRMARGEDVALDDLGVGTGNDPEERMAAFRRHNLDSSHEARYGENVETVLTRWREIQARTEKELAAIPDAALFETSGRHPLTRFEGPLWQFLLFYLEHESHHRGQLSAYLKTIGAAQPAAAFGR